MQWAGLGWVLIEILTQSRPHACSELAWISSPEYTHTSLAGYRYSTLFTSDNWVHGVRQEVLLEMCTSTRYDAILRNTYVYENLLITAGHIITWCVTNRECTLVVCRYRPTTIGRYSGFAVTRKKTNKERGYLYLTWYGPVGLLMCTILYTGFTSTNWSTTDQRGSILVS